METSKESNRQFYLEQARRLVASQLSKEHYERYVTEDRIADVARWLEKGWNVEAYFEDSEWREDGVGDDITYTGVVIKPVMK